MTLSKEIKFKDNDKQNSKIYNCYLEFLQLKYVRKIRYAYHGFFEGLSNIWKWRKIIWKDRDFDGGYLEDIILFKLTNMEKFFRSSDAYTVDAIETADQIKVTKDLLARVIEDDYVKEIDPQYYEKQLPFVRKENEDGTISHIYDVTEEERMEFRRIHVTAQQNKERERFEVYNQIATYIENWWD